VSEPGQTASVSRGNSSWPCVARADRGEGRVYVWWQVAHRNAESGLRHCMRHDSRQVGWHGSETHRQGTINSSAVSSAVRQHMWHSISSSFSPSSTACTHDGSAPSGFASVEIASAPTPPPSIERLSGSSIRCVSLSICLSTKKITGGRGISSIGPLVIFRKCSFL
jgi:hypothetical protein